MKEEDLKKDLRNSNQDIKLKALLSLIEVAKNGVDIHSFVKELDKILVSKNKKIWNAASDALTYYYKNFVSLYCRNYGSLPENIRQLRSQNKKERQSVAASLNGYTLLKEGRNWKYMKHEKIEKLIKDFKSDNVQIIKKTVKSLRKASNDFIEISEVVPFLETHLLNDDDEVRWICAEILSTHIGHYMGTLSVRPWLKFEEFKEKNANERAHFAKAIGSSCVYDIVSDRDERDISHALPGLALLLKDKSMRVRKAAIESLRVAQGEHDLSVFLPLIIDAILDKDRKDIHDQASDIIKKAIEDGFDISDHVEHFEKLISCDEAQNLRKDIILIMRKAVEKGYDLKYYITLFEKLLNDKIDEIKFGAADTLAYYHALKKNWKKIDELFQHEDKDVRQEAAGTLEKIKSNVNISPLFPQLKMLLNDEDKEVRFIAARTIMEKCSKGEDISPAVPILVEAISDEDERIRKNALYIMTKTIKYRIVCNSIIKKSDWKVFEPFISILEKLLKKKKENIVQPLTQYYVHNGKFDKIEELLKNRSPEVKQDVMFRLTTCGWSDCKVDISSLVPILISMHFTDKNKEVRNRALKKLEQVVKKSQISDVLEVIKTYDIDTRWALEESLRKKSKSAELWELEKILKNYDEQELKTLLPYLEHSDGIIRAWITDTLWNWVYKEDKAIKEAIPFFIKNLDNEDVFVRHVTLSVLGGIAREKFDITDAIPKISKLLLDKSQKVIHVAASTLSAAAEVGFDITEAIPELIKNINSNNKNISYYSSLAPRNYVNDKKTAEFVLKELENKKVDKRNKEVKRLVEKCRGYL